MSALDTAEMGKRPSKGLMCAAIRVRSEAIVDGFFVVTPSLK